MGGKDKGSVQKIKIFLLECIGVYEALTGAGSATWKLDILAVKSVP
jgi:hypothetical protein